MLQDSVKNLLIRQIEFLTSIKVPKILLRCQVPAFSLQSFVPEQLYGFTLRKNHAETKRVGSEVGDSYDPGNNLDGKVQADTVFFTHHRMIRRVLECPIKLMIVRMNDIRPNVGAMIEDG